MFCKYCGNEINDGVKFCPYCGGTIASSSQKEENQAGVSETDTTQSSSAKRSKAKIALLVIVLGVVLAAVAGAVYFFTSPARQLSESLSDEDYDSASKIYTSSVRDSSIQIWLTDRLLSGTVSDIVEEYGDGIIRYEDAREYLETVCDMTELNTAEEAVVQLENLETLYTSKEAYDLAESYYETGDYEAAMEAYQKVDESDTVRYEDAQNKITSAVESYRTQIIEKIGSPATVEEYETAINLLNSALAVLPGDEKLTSLLETCESERIETIRSTALSEAADAVAAGDYEKAFDLLNAALEYIQGDSDLQEMLASYQSQYETYISTQVADLVVEGDYDGALNIIEQALQVLPDSTVLDELQTVTENQKPVRLMDLTAITSDYVDVITTEVSDRLGNYYDGTVKFDASRDAYAAYRLDKEYTTFTATVFVPPVASSGKSMYISIYVDNELVYSVDSISEEIAPFSLSIDVTNATLLEIITGNDGSYSSGFLYFSDAILTR